MASGETPVFYDQSGRRRRRFAFAVIAFILLLLAALGVFVASIVAVSPQPALPFQAERPALERSQGPIGALAHDTKRGIRRALRYAGWWVPGKPGAGGQPLAISFHAPWDDESVDSLSRHVNDLDWLIPVWVSVTGPDHRFAVDPDLKGHAILANAVHRPKLLPMVQNAQGGNWDAKGIVALLHDPAQRKRLLDELEPELLREKADGAAFDFENLPATSHPDYLRFLAEARARFQPHKWLLTVAVPVGDEEWPLAAYAKVADKLYLMAYDEHDPSGDAGPIASQSWFVQAVAHAIRGVPREKVVVCFASYAYDWSKDTGADNTYSVEQAWLNAHESFTQPSFDPASANSTFSYDENHIHHTVWFADAATAWNQIAALRRAGLNQLALWRLGTEDPSIWQIFGRSHPTLPAADTIGHVPAGTLAAIEGAGEILRVGAAPTPGVRAITVDKRGLISGEAFEQLPLPYAIERAGYRPGLVALTFDDGPDPKWTPKILDILQEKGVHATFFVVGENALTNRSILKREVAEGHEVGNHTYTHPNLGDASASETRIELNATQRLVQAFTGRSMRLVRPPYFGDAEPTTADEINPVYEAQKMGYLSVGLHVDPDDWMRPGVPHIIQDTIDGVTAPAICNSNSDAQCSHNVVLLHDAGGDRSQTVQALPIIIDQLRARGYRFVRVSDLIGLRHDQIMPPIANSDRLAAEADLALFGSLGWFVQALGWLFMIAITLGIARAILLSALALWQAHRENSQIFPPIDPSRFVSVLIPAFNEARVIERSVSRVLESTEVTVEVIVIDDGSKDGTGDIVERAFAHDPRVRLLRLENGGKARALNQGLALAEGEIVIALDADTQFEPATIARLARWFTEPTLGAVAGNAKVGNRVNLVTRWQALEYITAQNLERRALARLGAMTVVPGAVGAWRKETLRQIGGYPADTLAEDQDLTIAIQRIGWDVRYDQYAIAWTEAPETFRALAKQRFRWAFGTLQCLWKHAGVISSGRPKGLARVGLPQAMLFQIGFAAISPVIDLALLVSIFTTWVQVEEHGWAQTEGTLERMLTYWIAFTLIDVLSGVVAFALERKERWRLLWLLVPQRIGYRQVMYYVVIKAVTQALRGPRVGWGKLERSGRVKGTA